MPALARVVIGWSFVGGGCGVGGMGGVGGLEGGIVVVELVGGVTEGEGCTGEPGGSSIVGAVV